MHFNLISSSAVFSEVLETWLFLALFQVGFWLPQTGSLGLLFFLNKDFANLHMRGRCHIVLNSENQMNTGSLSYEYLPYKDCRNALIVLPLSPALRNHPTIWGQFFCPDLMSLPFSLLLLFIRPTILILFTYLLISSST